MNRNRLVIPLLLSLCVAFALAACSVSVGGSTIDEKKLETAGKKFLKGKTGDEKVDTVKCPKDKDAKKNSKFDCTFEGSEGTTGTLAIELTDDDGGYTMEVGSIKHTKAAVEAAITENIKATYPDHADEVAAVVCPDDIPGKAGDTFTCNVSDTSGHSGDLTVTIGSDLAVTWNLSELFG